MMPADPIFERVSLAGRVWLLLDYDGTLADFAPTPDDVIPDATVIDLLTRLAQRPNLRVAVVSGRRLSHIEKLVPVPGVLLAGTYGIELRSFAGERSDRIDLQQVRPALERIKPRWQQLILGRAGFYLEDKNWSLALHGRFADEQESDHLMATARRLAEQVTGEMPAGTFRLLGGHKFLEIGPRPAHKGKTTEYLLTHYPLPGALPIYIGDDDKDEEAFGVVHAHGGIAVRVGSGRGETVADARLGSPRATHDWLEMLLASLARTTERGAPPDGKR